MDRQTVMNIKGKEVSDFIDSLDTKNMTISQLDILLNQKFPNLERTDWLKPINEKIPV